MRDEASPNPLDLELLARQTLGDRDLEADLFDLFEAQAERLWPVLAGAADDRGRAEAAHSLKGAAAAVGAVEVMRLAGAIELAPERADATLARLEVALAAARAAINTWRVAR